MPTIKEPSSICGKLVKIGGKEKCTALIEVPGSGLVLVELDREMARKLAPHLFEFVRIEGEVSWDIRTWRMTRITAHGFSPFHPEQAGETLKKLSEEFGKCFGVIEDVVEYVRKIRGEENF